jgi:hypothetical protein
MRRIIVLLALLAVAALVGANASRADTGPIQVAGQSAGTSQQAAAGSSATQTNPSNTNVDIRVLSPGNDGNVTQTNAVGSNAAAGNASSTTQSGTQSASGGGVQTLQQQAVTGQLAAALSSASQTGASNTNVPIRVLSGGNDGNVTQTNAVGSNAGAGNLATTAQTGSQSQAGGGSCACSATGSQPIQTSDQGASTQQAALAGSSAKQTDPSNVNVSIRVLSGGNDGNVTQSNVAGSNAVAGNGSTSQQSSTQAAAGSQCGCGSSAIQSGQQSAGTEQGAGALSGTDQSDPSNGTQPVAASSAGNGGNVSQLNGAGSSAAAGNASGTSQATTQSAGADPIQLAKQDAQTEQGALAGSTAEQDGASNDSSPVRVLSPGNGGTTTQANSASSSANAANLSGTTQGVGQAAAAGCGCSSSGLAPIQIASEDAGTGQSATALSSATQLGGKPSTCGCGGASASNTADPTRVESGGNDGNVTQVNGVGSNAAAGNLAGTSQGVQQVALGGSCGCKGDPIQVVGQQAGTGQWANAGSEAAQVDPSNDASPTRVLSGGNGGDVQQLNAVGSAARAGNGSATTQSAGQAAAGGGLQIQVIGQLAQTLQQAGAGSAAWQIDPSNDSSPTRVLSDGNDGAIRQGNVAESAALAGNDAATHQGGWQLLGGPSCGCSTLPIQVLGQQAWSGQTAAALSAVLQKWPSNSSSPTRAWSSGNGGALLQWNSASSLGLANNRALTGQGALQLL